MVLVDYHDANGLIDTTLQVARKGWTEKYVTYDIVVFTFCFSGLQEKWRCCNSTEYVFKVPGLIEYCKYTRYTSRVIRGSS